MYVTFVTCTKKYYFCAMNKIYNSPIFNGLTRLEIDLILNEKHRVTNYKAGELIAIQGSLYHSLLLIDSGIVRGEMSSFAGNSMLIEEIEAPRIIAPAIIFDSDNRFAVTVVAVTDAVIVSIKESDFTNMMQLDYRILHNFVRSISDRNKFLSDRVRTMSFGTIKSKIANYLLSQMKQKQNVEFDIPHTQQELADMFGVTRPALSRAISQMAETGIMRSHKNHFIIKDENKLKELAVK